MSLPIDRIKGAWAAVRCELRTGSQVDHGQPRGVALIIVLMTLAIVAAFSAEYNYKSYIRLHVAANMRDDVTAYYHARAAMEVARLVIKSQTLVENTLKSLGGGAMAKQAKQVEPWTLACQFANAFCTGKLILLGKPMFDFTGMAGVGVEEGGSCKCVAKPEAGSMSVNRINTVSDKRQLFRHLYAKMIAGRDEPLLPGEIDKEAAELVLNIIDWIDPDTQRTDIDLQGNLIESAQGEKGAGDKDIKPKNAKIDTLQELQFVEGMTPQKYCSMADSVTAFPTLKVNINQIRPDTLKDVLCDPYYTSNMVEACYLPGGGITGIIPPMDEAIYCLDICRKLRQSLVSPGFSNITQVTRQFFKNLRGDLLGKPILNNRAVETDFGVKAKFIRIETAGTSYGTARGLTAVIDTATGDYVYWREY